MKVGVFGFHLPVRVFAVTQTWEFIQSYLTTVMSAVCENGVDSERCLSYRRVFFQRLPWRLGSGPDHFIRMEFVPHRTHIVTNDVAR